MRSKTKAFFIIINFLVQPYLVAQLHAESIRISDKGSAQEMYLSVLLPPKDRLTLVSVVPMTAGEELLGGVAAYDDAATRRPADYLELFNNVGALLAVGWFDRFGIERLAVDRALVEDGDKLEGVFVLILTGDSI
jgi:hypothetical protein